MANAWPPTAWRDLAFAPGLVVAMLTSGPAPAQAPADTVTRRGAILVQVTDTSINPLAAEIVLPALGLGVRLSEEGTVSLVNVPDGVYVVQARHPGHDAAWTLLRVADDTVSVHFILSPAIRPEAERRSDRPLDGVAHARLLSFLSRGPAISSGSFLTRGEIRRRRARSMTALLGRVRDVRVERSSDGRTVVQSKSAPTPGCVGGMLVFVDAMPLGAQTALAAAEPGESRAPRRDWLRWIGAVGRGHVSLSAIPPAPAWRDDTAPERAGLDLVAVSSVAAVEVYPTAAGVPPEFRLPGWECGAVLIWR